MRDCTTLLAGIDPRMKLIRISRNWIRIKFISIPHKHMRNFRTRKILYRAIEKVCTSFQYTLFLYHFLLL